MHVTFDLYKLEERCFNRLWNKVSKVTESTFQLKNYYHIPVPRSSKESSPAIRDTRRKVA